jgi:hypothetical protein
MPEVQPTTSWASLCCRNQSAACAGRRDLESVRAGLFDEGGHQTSSGAGSAQGGRRLDMRDDDLPAAAPVIRKRDEAFFLKLKTLKCGVVGQGHDVAAPCDAACGSRPRIRSRTKNGA